MKILCYFEHHTDFTDFARFLLPSTVRLTNRIYSISATNLPQQILWYFCWQFTNINEYNRSYIKSTGFLYIKANKKYPTKSAKVDLAIWVKSQFIFNYYTVLRNFPQNFRAIFIELLYIIVVTCINDNNTARIAFWDNKNLILFNKNNKFSLI